MFALYFLETQNGGLALGGPDIVKHTIYLLIF